MKLNDTDQLFCIFSAVFRHAAGECIALGIVGMAHVVDAGEHRAEGLAVGDDAANRYAAKADTVVATFTANQTGASALSDRALIGERNLQCGVHAFRSGIGEKDMVQRGGHHGRETRCKFKCLGMAHLEGGCIVQLGNLLLDRFNDLGTGVTGVAAPEAGRAVENLAAVCCGVMHVLGRHEHAWGLLELPIGRERHPESFEIVGGSLARC